MYHFRGRYVSFVSFSIPNRLFSGRDTIRIV
nr:MAG TPA: hypothetical protein [Caudoviricetes sp.]